MNRLLLGRRGLLLATIVLVAAVAPFAVFAVPQAVGADDSFVVLSGSMEPMLSPGDVVIVDASRSVGPGDVITFTRGGDVPITHRVLEVRDGNYVTKGDANEDTDAGVVTPAAVLGRVVFVIPFIGHIILWANTPIGYVTLVITPFVLLAISELYAWARRPSDGENAQANALEDGQTHDTVPRQAVRRLDVDDDVSGRIAEQQVDVGADQSVPLAIVDLKLTLLAMGSLLVYAAWNVHGDFALGAPNPVSIGVLTGALLGLLLATWVTVGAWQTARSATAVAIRGAAQTDGGATVEDDHE